MTILKRYKTLLIAVVVIAIAFAGYSYFFPASNQPVLSTLTPSSATPAVDQDLIKLLATLKAIKLDPAIFSDSGFQSLQDFSQTLIPETVGRVNPFAPLAGISGLKPQTGPAIGTTPTPTPATSATSKGK